ncbi:MAG: hypothetical protein J6O41_01555 [Clostridia bacterium]|nr:hypothetical protein [Clostridia bacterium]
MRKMFANIIIKTTILLISSVFIVFGIMIWEEYKSLQTSMEPSDFETNVTFGEQETIDTNIKAPIIVENVSGSLSDGNSNNISYDNISIDKYFYNQLEEEAKIIYKAFEENKENMKTGTYRIDFGTTFSNLLKKENGSNLLSSYYQSAIEAFNYDNPEIFYLSPNKMYLNIETISKSNNISYNVYINNGNELNYLDNQFSSKGEIDQAIQLIEQRKNEIIQNRTGNTYSDIKMVHDYLVDDVQYDVTTSKANIYNIYGTLINGEAVCEGYARSFKYIMDSLEIPCIMVIGKGTNSEGRTENHAWNYVKINDIWYAIDVTWDDPVSRTGWIPRESKYKYFLKSSAEISKDHTPIGQFTEGGKIFEYPNLSTSNYE